MPGWNQTLIATQNPFCAIVSSHAWSCAIFLPLIQNNLTCIPGVGSSIQQDLYSLGINKISDLENKSPEALYEQLCRQQGMHIDRCVLYVFRCAVYFASANELEEEKLKWWWWGD